MFFGAYVNTHPLIKNINYPWPFIINDNFDRDVDGVFPNLSQQTPTISFFLGLAESHRNSSSMASPDPLYLNHTVILTFKSFLNYLIT